MKKLFYMIFFLLLFNLDIVSAFVPIEDVSQEKNCEYRIYGQKYDGTSLDKGFVDINCNAINIDLNAELGVDGVYFVDLTSIDQNVIGGGNSMRTQTYGPYEKDSHAPVCKLDNITLYGVDNQYFNNGKFYYKSADGASGKFSITISCKDTDTKGAICNSGSCVGGIKSLDFPTILGKKPSSKFYNIHLRRQ